MNTIETLSSPFKHLVMTIGELPTTFVESMSYYEALAWLVNYIEKTLLPAVNNNAEATKELQADFVELKNYVDSYFDNLNIQSEIDNKLDEMAESGQLAEIITAYVELQGVLAFNTVADMKTAENLIDGSFTMTYGKNALNDGYGRKYKVRELINTDVVDDENIIALHDPNLVAVLIKEGEIDDIKSDISSLEYSHDVELQWDLIYDETGTNVNQGCAMIGNILYSCEYGSDYTAGKIVTFDLSTHTYGTTYSNLTIWHGADAAALNNKIYIASWDASANKAIAVFDPANQSITHLNPFTYATKSLVGCIAEHNGKLLCKLEENSNLELLVGAEYMMYDPSDNSVVEYTMYNPKHLAIDYYGWTQGSCCNGDKYYILTASPNSIVECKIDDVNHTLTMEAIYSLPTIDSRGLFVGEVQGIAMNPNVPNEMIITTYAKDTSVTDVHTTKVYRLNLVDGNPDGTKGYYTQNMAENGHQAIIVDKTSTSLLEVGDQYYPFKSLSRAVACATHQNKQYVRPASIQITGNGTYDLPKIYNSNLTIRANDGVIINFYQINDNSQVTFASISTRPKIVFMSSYSASQIDNNSTVLFDNVVLENSEVVTIRKSIVRSFTCLVNANNNMFNLYENATFYDGSHTAWTFGDASYYAYNVTSGSQLFMFDNQEPFSPNDVGSSNKRIIRSDRRGIVIFPKLYS